jgi:hypothetical protein
MKKTFDCRYFLEKFFKIPENKWTVGQYEDAQGKKCALGHCGEGAREITKESLELDKLFMRPEFIYVTAVNDGGYENTELGDTPKERILNALIMIESGILEEV